MIIERGSKNEERLYLYDDEFDLGDDHVIVEKTDMPNIENIITRHKARYMLPAFFYRPGMNILDFPCGSGYGHEIFNYLSNPSIHYEGRDNDPSTIRYCKRRYYANFLTDDLTDSHLSPNTYDLIACIEGIEHIEQKYQSPLIRAFYEALKPDGVLIVSSPEAPEGISGPSRTNPYHLWELSRLSLVNILGEYFDDVQILRHKDTLHNGQKATCLYGICRKEGSKWK